MGCPMATSQDFATWTCTPALLPKYLMFALMAEGENIRNFGEGSTHTTIYFPEIRALHICLAPLAEQHEIVSRIDRAFAWIERLANEAGNAYKLIDHLDRAVLDKAFRGELVPQDPNDEPASVLLERIKLERQTSLAERLKKERSGPRKGGIRLKRQGGRR
jgi:type I restriction enzyme S subunit